MRVALVGLSLISSPSLGALMDRPTLFTQVGLVHLSTLISLSLSTLFLRSPSLFFLFSFFLFRR
jgi:hypothetical protein